MRFFFRKQQRVVSGADFTRILRKGAFAADGTLVVHAIAAPGCTGARIGVTIPKKVGNAVVRNRWKRWIRESYRTQQDRIPPGYDYIIRPKKGAVPEWTAIQKSVPGLANRAVKRDRARRETA